MIMITTVTKTTEHSCTVRTICMLCGKPNTTELPVQAEKLAAWLNARRCGENPPLIQDAFPELTVAQREVLLSGAHDECFDSTFGEKKPRFN